MNMQYLYFIFILLTCMHEVKFCEAMNETVTTKETFIIRYYEGKRIVPVKVELDVEQQTEHVTTLNSNNSWISMSLKDLIEKKVAYKDVNRNHCFVADATEESLESDRRRLEGLNNGVVKGFYIPTLFFFKDIDNATTISKKFGKRIAEFCNGMSVSYVTKENVKLKRKKRQVTGSQNNGQKGQFTHHSYGHYGHQSNNYAHYGHETHITGTVDKDGIVKDQRISQYQERSRDYQSYPSSNGEQQTPVNVKRSSFSSPSVLQNSQPGQDSFGNNKDRNFRRGSAGQFSLQTTQESGYQLNLPLGLRGGNMYRSGINANGQYGVGGTHPSLYSDHKTNPMGSSIQRYPSSSSPGFHVHPSSSSDILQTRYPSSHDVSKISNQGSVNNNGENLVGPVLTSSNGDQEAYPSREIAQGGQSGITSGLTGTHPSLTSLSGIQSRISSQSTTQDGFAHRPESRPETRDLDYGTRFQLGMPSGGYEAGNLPATGIPGHIPGSYPDVRKFGHQPGIQPEFVRNEFQPGIPARSLTNEDHLGSFVHGYPTGLQPTSAVNGYQPRSTMDGYQPGIQHGLPIAGYQPEAQPKSIITGRQSGLPSQSTITGYQRPESSVFEQQPGITTIGNARDSQRGISEFRYKTPDIPATDQRSQHQRTTIMNGRNFQNGFGPLEGRERRISVPESQAHGIQISQPRYIDSQMTNRQQQTPLPVSGQQPSSGIHGVGSTGSFTGTHDSVEQQRTRTMNGRDSQNGLGPLAARDGRISVPESQTQGIQISQPRYIDGQITNRQQQIPHPVSGHQPSSGIHSAGLTGPFTGTQDSGQSGFTGGSRDTRFQDTRAVPSGYPGFSYPAILETRQQGGYPESHISETSNQSPEQLSGTTPGLSRASDTLPVPNERDRLGGITRAGSERSVAGGAGDSASSQTQIQTGAEGTAAEAFSSGQFRGLGSQTQVQGGYVGNGSFSAQAQSGFTGGITQSQVQGGKQGGLSGSSAIVENLGSAQSQVQIGRPSGSASSTAQGRFSRGMTQVKAQSGKSGGSAGAESQSSGLSSSQVQVDIAGEEVKQASDFQGTVSASVQGGQSSGQSQTQLQGGYNSGRTYVATAQGGFDSLADFQGSIPLPGSSPVIQNRGSASFPLLSSDKNGNVRQTYQTPGSGSAPHISANHVGSSTIPGFTGGSSIPVSRGISSAPGQERNGQILRPSGSADVSQIPRAIGSHAPQSSYTTGTRPLLHPPSTGLYGQRDLSQQTGPESSINTKIPSEQIHRQRTPIVTSPSQSSTFIPTSPHTGHRLGQDQSQLSGFQRPLTAFPSSSQTDHPGGHISATPQYPTISAPDQHGVIQSPSSYLPQTPRNLTSMLQPNIYSNLRPSSQQIPRTPQSEYQPSILQPPFSGTSQSVPQNGLYGGLNGLQPPYPPSQTQNIRQTSFTPTRQQNGFQTPEFHQGFYQQSSHLPGSIPDTPSTPGRVRQASPRTDHFAATGTGNFEGASSTSFQQPELTPGQYQPSFDLPSSTSGMSVGGLRQVSPSQIDHSASTDTSPSRVHSSRDRQPQPVQRPGALEPDLTGKESCCDALRNLKSRCCDRSSQGKTGSCCSSSVKDFTKDFGAEDISDEDSNGEPCKVVKAICYIVYKPVGKARICKPTTTNNC